MVTTSEPGWYSPVALCVVLVRLGGESGLPPWVALPSLSAHYQWRLSGPSQREERVFLMFSASEWKGNLREQRSENEIL